MDKVQVLARSRSDFAGGVDELTFRGTGTLEKTDYGYRLRYTAQNELDGSAVASEMRLETQQHRAVVITESKDGGYGLLLDPQRQTVTQIAGGDGGALTLHVDTKEVSWHLPRKGEGHITLAYTLLLGTQALSALQQDVAAMQERQAEAKRLRNEGMEAMHQQEIAVAREQERVFNASSELQAHTQRLEKTQQAITQLTESIAEIRADLQLLTEGTQSAAVDREALDQKTEELQNALRAARDQADGLRDQVTQQRLQFAEMEHSIETLRRDKARWAEESAALQGTLNALREKIAAQRQQAQEAEGQLAQLRQAAQQQAEAARQADADTDQLEQKRQAQLAHQRELVEESERLHERYTQDGDQLHRTEILYDRADNEQKTLSEHMWNTYEATLATAEEFRLPAGEFALTSGERDANGLRREIRELGPINAHAVEEYAQTKERFDDLSRQKEDMTKAESDLRGLIKRLLSQMEKQFVTEFDRLNGYFQQTFVRLFGGGQAELKLTDPNDPLCCGIEVVAQPPGKKLQNLTLLSGGEHALTAIALLFALLQVSPAPFLVLDEIEAALDDENVYRFGDYIRNYGNSTQFVVITHRRGTMEAADVLYGVTMQERGVSRLLSMKLEDVALEE